MDTPIAKKALTECIELLCGQDTMPTGYSVKFITGFPEGGLGRGQLNEILLAYQLDRIGEGLFKFIFKEEPVNDFETFKRRILDFRTLGAVHFGNFKYAYKFLRDKSFDVIERKFGGPSVDIEAKLRLRHSPIVDLLDIEPEDTYFLGYIVDQELAERGGDNEFRRKVESARERGSNNHEIYLDYDHMDVYIATSMRERLDFWNVARFARELQDNKAIRDLKLRFFDPTQAYCKDRIDKGLVEGLMLKRAKCTIYLAGESETLGKDSELAATLAQGKTVIAYVPNLEPFDKFRTDYVEKVFSQVYPDQKRMEVALKFLQIYWPEGAWKSENVRNWIQNRDEAVLDEVVQEVYERARGLYERRAKTLKDIHPLGLQVNLDTGVANGVLVVRTIPERAELLKKVILRQLEFRLDKRESVYAVVEVSTGSIYRVVTQDAHLTNSFWNFYFERDPKMDA